MDTRKTVGAATGKMYAGSIVGDNDIGIMAVGIILRVSLKETVLGVERLPRIGV